MLLGSTAVAADPPKADPPKQEEQRIDPRGQPSAYTQSIERATYYIWHADGEWHVRTRTKEKSRSFVGTLRIQGGKLTSLTDKQRVANVGKKGKVKPPKTPDRGWISPDRRTVKFSFTTSGGEDGFDFKVDGDAKSIEFDLAVKGFDHPERILIGKEGAHPAAAKFSLPAHPDS